MLLIGGCIHTVENGTLDNGYLRIENGKIAEVGSMETFPYRGEEAEKSAISLEGKAVYPGFIDAHSHIGLWEDGLRLEGEDGNEDSDPITPQMHAIDGINPCDTAFEDAYRAGVTTVVVGPGSANPIGGRFLAMKTCGVRIEDMLLSSDIGMKFSLGENPKWVYREKDEAPLTRMGIASMIREQLHKAVQYRENMRQSDPKRSLEYDGKAEALLPLLEGKAKAFFHCHRTDDIFTAIRISREFSLSPVMIHATEGYLIADMLQKEQIPVVIGPVLSDRGKPELRAHSISMAAVLAEAGVSFAICTDHPEVPQQYLPLSAGLAIRGGLTRSQALRAITINPAQIMGIDHRVGSISVGKDADVTIYKKEDDPFSVYAQPEMVMMDGKIVYNKQER